MPLITRDFSMMLEFGGTVAGSLLPIEWTSNISRDQPLAIEKLTAVRMDEPTPTESLATTSANLTSDSSLQIETLATIRRDL